MLALVWLVVVWAITMLTIHYFRSSKSGSKKD